MDNVQKHKVCTCPICLGTVNYRGWILTEKLIIAQPGKSIAFYGPEDYLPCSQQTATEDNPEPAAARPHFYCFLKMRFNAILRLSNSLIYWYD
jgi:hypothetical protein